MDVVYAIGSGSRWQLDNELKYSLRSLALFLSGIDRIFIVGKRPAFLKNVVHLPFNDRNKCKEKNIMEKVMRACQDDRLSREFLFVNDDHFALKPQTLASFPNYASRSLEALGKAVKSTNPYKKSVQNTATILKSRGLTEYNFDVHLPIVYDKLLFPKVMNGYDWKNGCYVVKSLYGNTVGLNPTIISDMKLNRDYTNLELVRLLKPRPWFSIGNGALKPNFKNLMVELYLKPSPWERG